MTVGREIAIEPGATYVFDKGYSDYNWWLRFTQRCVHFFTRFKNNAALTVSETRTPQGENILSDEVVEFKNRRPGGGRINKHHGTALRRISVQRDIGEITGDATVDVRLNGQTLPPGDIGYRHY